MAELKCITMNNCLQIINYPILTSGSKGVDTFSVVLDESWQSVDGADQYYALFSKYGSSYPERVSLSITNHVGTCAIPDVVLSEAGHLVISIICANNNGTILKVSDNKMHPILYGIGSGGADGDDEVTLEDFKMDIAEALNERYGTTFSNNTDVSELLDFLYTVQTANEARSIIALGLNEKFSLNLQSNASEENILSAIDGIPLGMNIVDIRTYEEVQLV